MANLNNKIKKIERKIPDVLQIPLDDEAKADYKEVKNFCKKLGHKKDAQIMRFVLKRFADSIKGNSINILPVNNA